MKILIITIIALSFSLPLMSQCSFGGCGPMKPDEKVQAQRAEKCETGPCEKCECPTPKQEIKEKCLTCEICKCEKCECPKAKIIDTETLARIVEEKSALIFDARSGKWDDGFRIPGAKSLNDKSSSEEIAKHIPAKDSPIVVYCSNTKCPASDRLARHLSKLGYTNIHEYPEGIDGWRAAGKPVEKTP